MAHSVSKIVTEDFATVRNTGVEVRFQDQKKLAITLIVVGTILVLGSVVALAYTTSLNPAVPVAFGILLAGGVVVAVSPVRKDWTPYHTEKYFNTVHRRFQTFENVQDLKRLFKDFRFDKLRQFAYIGPDVTDAYSNCVEYFQANTLDKNQAALNRWNGQFA